MKRLKRAPIYASLAPILVAAADPASVQIGRELSSHERLEDGEEHAISLRELIRRGKAAFRSEWTPQQGGGRPLSKGVGSPLSDLGAPSIFQRNFNRVSAMGANSCAGCHNQPFGIPGGGGDFVTCVFVAAQRFDFATFDHGDFTTTKGAIDESTSFARLQTIGNYRATFGMFGSRFVDMLARQMTGDLQAIRDATSAGEANELVSKGIRFGTIRRDANGNWDISAVEGLPAPSLLTTGLNDLPTLIIHPFHQSGSVVSIRQITNNAFNHHHGMQSAERFGYGVDADGDGFVNELTRADITAISVFQATLPVPGQVIPPNQAIRAAIEEGEALFDEVGCTACHVPALPLVDEGWIYTEPNPFNPDGNLQIGAAPQLSVDLTQSALPGRKLKPKDDVVWVPAFTDMKLHDITSGPGDLGGEAIDINEPARSAEFLGGNRRFLTKKLWGAANERPYFHHGLFTTLRESVLAHAGQALAARTAFQGSTEREQDRGIEFLKSLQVLPPGP